MYIEEVTETRIATIKKDKNGVLVIVLKKCGPIDTFDLLDYGLVLRRKCDNKPALKLVFALHGFNVRLKARRILNEEDGILPTKACAYVVSGNARALMRNVISRFRNKPYERRFFTNSDAAYSWLMARA